MTGAEVVLTGITRYYGDTPAARDVSLAVAGGEFVTLLGPSGSGKTTTLMIVAGFVEPSAGDVRIGGQSVIGVPPHRRNLGVVFQSYALFPHMSVFDNVAFPLWMRRIGRPEARRRVHEALEMVQLGGLAARRIQQLSGGQQQRVALARALVFEPPVLLMDEPLGALDRKLRAEMQLEIKRLQRTLGLTAIYVTHDQEEALTLSDRIAIMHEGAIRQVGTPAEVYERPATAFIADFVGESNLLGGVVEAASPEGVTVRLAAGGVRVHGPAAAVNAGQTVRLMIRPEALSLRDGGGASPNSLAGVVEEALYLGQAIRYTVRAGELVLTVREPHRTADPTFARQARVTVSWPRHATILVAP